MPRTWLLQLLNTCEEKEEESQTGPCCPRALSFSEQRGERYKNDQGPHWEGPWHATNARGTRGFLWLLLWGETGHAHPDSFPRLHGHGPRAGPKEGDGAGKLSPVPSDSCGGSFHSFARQVCIRRPIPDTRQRRTKSCPHGASLLVWKRGRKGGTAVISGGGKRGADHGAAT